jgi:hypothetical protein
LSLPFMFKIINGYGKRLCIENRPFEGDHGL